MPVRRATAFALASAVAVAGLVGCGSARKDGASGVANDATTVLFSMEIDSGSLSATADGYELRVRPTSGSLVWFTDRPARLAGRLGVAELVDGWDADFGDDPPNAALVIDELLAGAGPSGDAGLVEGTIAFTVDRPVLNDDGSLTFEASIVEDLIDAGPFAHLGRLATGDERRDFQQASLFIDAAAANEENFAGGAIAGDAIAA